MSEKKIELYKTRDFGEKINATIEYIRFNFGPLIKVVLVLVLPLGIVASLMLKNIFGTFGGMMSNPNMDEVERVGQLSSLGGNYMLTMIMSMVTYSFLVAAIYTFLSRRDKGESVEPMEVIKEALKSVPGLFGLMIVTGILTVLGFFVFILPGIYLAFVFSLSFPIYMFEGQDFGTAFSKPFKLIRDKWWSTFGLLIITSIIAAVISYVFLIPSYAIMFGQMFSDPETLQNDPNAVFESLSSWTTTITMAFAMMGTYLTYLIPIIALGFQYFNLSERMEGTGLKNQIQDFENLG
ncbi:MAG: YciC family protein [Marinoscillum sp.]